MLAHQRKVVLASLLSLLAASTNAQTIAPLPAIDNKDVQIWWGPMIIALDSTGSIDFTLHDFPKLLTDPVQWTQTRAAITTLGLPAGIFPGYDQMSNIIHWLHHHPTIKVVMPGEFVATGGLCGSGEGLTTDPVYGEQEALSAQAWQQAGGRLDYSAMDEPLTFARVPTSQGGCGWTIQQIAENVSRTMKVVQQSFPDVKFIDQEAPGVEPTDEWLADMHQFHNALAALGTPVYSTEIDESWNNMENGETYSQVVSKSVSFFHINGEHVGIFLNLDGTVADQADSAAYLDQYRYNAQTIANGHFGEDYVSVESWNWNLPVYNLPETTATAFSSIIPLLQRLLKGH